MKFNKAIIDCGVTHRSILDTLLFSIYVNNIFKPINTKQLLYDHKANILVTGETVNQISLATRQEQETLSDQFVITNFL